MEALGEHEGGYATPVGFGGGSPGEVGAQRRGSTSQEVEVIVLFGCVSGCSEDYLVKGQVRIVSWRFSHVWGSYSSSVMERILRSRSVNGKAELLSVAVVGVALGCGSDMAKPLCSVIPDEPMFEDEQAVDTVLTAS